MSSVPEWMQAMTTLQMTLPTMMPLLDGPDQAANRKMASLPYVDAKFWSVSAVLKAADAQARVSRGIPLSGWFWAKNLELIHPLEGLGLEALPEHQVRQ